MVAAPGVVQEVALRFAISVSARFSNPDFHTLHLWVCVGPALRHSSLQNSLHEWQTDLRKGEVAASQDASAQGAPNARQKWFPIRTLEEEEDRRREMQLAAQLNHPDLAFAETNAWRTAGSGVAPRLRVAVPGTPLTGTSRITTPASGSGPVSAASSLMCVC